MQSTQQRSSNDATRYSIVTEAALGEHRNGAIEVWHAGGFKSSGDLDEARYEWFYRDNPAGHGLVSFLLHDENRVGFLGVGCRRMLLDGEPIVAGVLVDFVVHPAHRTAAPALSLQRTVREQALRTMPVLYGLPDTKAILVFKRLGATVSFGLPTYARVLRSEDYLEKKMPPLLARVLGAAINAIDRLHIGARLLFTRLLGEWTEVFDERFDDLWSRFAKQGTCIGVRDRAFLRWRFENQPGRKYRIFTIRLRDSKALLMYFVCEVQGARLAVKDCLSAGTLRELTSGLLLLARAARALGVTAVHLQIANAADFETALKKAFYSRRAERPFFGMAAASAYERAASATWYVTPADEDV